jgi:hypothetical protein
MRGLMGDRLLKWFVGSILHPPEFNRLRVLGSTSDNDETTTNPSETTEEKAQSRTPERSGETTNASASEAGDKPPTDGNAVSDNLGSSTDAAMPLS